MATHSRILVWKISQIEDSHRAAKESDTTDQLSTYSIKEIANKALLYTRGNSAQYLYNNLNEKRI